MTTTAIITHRDCQLHDMGSHHPECPQRLTAINDHLIAQGIDAYFVYYDAPLATFEQLMRVHPLPISNASSAPRRNWASCTSTPIPR